MRELHLNAFVRPHGVDLGAVLTVVRAAERACFDAVIFDDFLGAPTEGGDVEPGMLVAALSAVTSRVGLIATASTAWHAPYHLARTFAAVDHISRGRAGWHVVAAGNDVEAGNVGFPAPADPYDRAEEFVDVVTGLWDSFDDDAFHHDKETGQYFDPAKLHTLDHKGPHLSVAGPLNIPRPPQGRPVIMHSPTTEAGLRFAARTADVVVPPEGDLAAATETYAEIKARAAEFGRDPDSVKVLPALTVTADAADHMETWFHTPAADGFTLTVPGGLAEFAESVVPELRNRALLRDEYTGTTLRDHLAVERPRSRYERANLTH